MDAMPRRQNAKHRKSAPGAMTFVVGLLSRAGMARNSVGAFADLESIRRGRCDNMEE